MADKTTHYAVNADTLFKSILFTIFFAVMVALYLTHENKDINQDMNVLRLEMSLKAKSSEVQDMRVEMAEFKEKVLWNEAQIVERVEREQATYHKNILERNDNGEK